MIIASLNDYVKKVSIVKEIRTFIKGYSKYRIKMFLIDEPITQADIWRAKSEVKFGELSDKRKKLSGIEGLIKIE